jgi:1-phosphofructokinase family hexose kinase
VILCVATTPAIDRLFEVARLVPGEIHRPERHVAVAGGKGLNVARAMATLGGDVHAIAPLGGHAGAWIAAELEREGIPAEVVDVPGETRSCLTVAHASGGGLTEFYENAEPLGEDGWERLEAAILRRLGEADGMTLSGSLPPGAPRDGHARLITAARAAGVRVAVDTHGEPLEHALRAGPDLVKVNAAEAEPLVGREHQAAALLDLSGGRAAVVTHGAEGLELCDEEGRAWRGRPPALGRYPVASGDACLAGMVWGRADGGDWAEALALGLGAAAANAEQPGAARLDAERARELAAEARKALG